MTLLSQAQIAVNKSAYRIAGTDSDYGDFIQTDSTGNVYVVGRYSTGCDFDPSSGTSTLVLPPGNTDLYLAKYTSAGNLVWVYSIGGSGSFAISNRLEIDPTGNLYLVGDYYSTFTINNSGNPVILTSNGSNDAFLLKFNPSGQLLFSLSIGDANSETIEDIAFAPNGDFFIGGEYSSTTLDLDPGAGVYTLTNGSSSTFGYDPFLAKFDSLGNYLWGMGLPGLSNADYIKGVVVDDNGRVIVGGYFSGSMVVDSISGAAINTNNIDYDCFLARFNSNGAYDNSWSFGGSGYDYLYSIATFNNNIYTTGTFDAQIDLAPGADTLYAITNGGYDVFVSCYNSSGVAQWGGNLGGQNFDEVQQIKTNSIGDVFVVGAFVDSADFNLQNSSNYLISYGDRDGFITKYNGATGNLIWSHKMGGVFDDYSRGIAFTSNNEFWTSGYYNASSLRLNPLNLQATLPNLGSNDGYFARFGECSFPVLTLQPLTESACPGSSVSFSVAGTGQNVSYQWQEGTNGGITWNNLIDGGNYAGSTNPTLSINNVALNFNNRFYRCVIAADCGLSITSGVGILFVAVTNTSVTATSGSLTVNQTNANYQWLDCANGNAAIAGAINQIFTPSINGSYAVQISRNGCIDTTSCYTITTAGIYDLDLTKELKMFPVPADKVLNLEMRLTADYEASVYDLSGRNLLTNPVVFNSTATIPIEMLDSGVYLVGIKKNGGEPVFTRFVKN